MQINIDERGRNLLDLMRSPFLRAHFSQLGEDCLLWHYFHERPHGFYVDVGCHDPFRYSNTYLLHRFLNWSGINIDADPRAIAKFKDARPFDVNINLGIGAVEEYKAFTMFEDGAVNTFDPMLAEQQACTFVGAHVVEIPVRRLERVLEEYVPPGRKIDYMNVDCEGLDHDVINSNDWNRFRPEILSVEIHGLELDNPTANRTIRLLRDQGYKMRSHYHATTFFERR